MRLSPCEPPKRCPGPTGPTGPSDPRCCQLGMLLYVIDEDVEFVNLDNLTYDHARYDAVSFEGTLDGTPRIVLPAAATYDDSYEVTIENRADGPITISADESTGDTFDLDFYAGVEQTLEQEITDNAAATSTYRTRVLVTPAGAYRVPGFSTSA